MVNLQIHEIMNNKIAQEFKLHLETTNLTQNSKIAYNDDVTKFINFISTDFEIKDLTQVECQDFVNSMYAQGISPNTANRIISGVRRFFKFCLTNDYIDNIPMHDMITTKVIHTAVRVLSIEEVDQLKLHVRANSNLQTLRNIAIIDVLHHTGIRVSELISLTLNDLALKRKVINVRGREIPLNKEVITSIRIYLKTRDLLNPNKLDTNILFLNRRGIKLSRVMIFTFLKKYGKLASIERLSPSVFRSTFAQDLLSNKTDTKIVQLLMGYSSLVTLEVLHMNL